MNDSTILGIAGIMCLTAIEVVALFQNLDGQVFGTIVAAIAGIAGAALGIKIAQKKEVGAEETG